MKDGLNYRSCGRAIHMTTENLDKANLFIETSRSIPKKEQLHLLILFLVEMGGFKQHLAAIVSDLPGVYQPVECYNDCQRAIKRLIDRILEVAMNRSAQ